MGILGLRFGDLGFSGQWFGFINYAFGLLEVGAPRVIPGIHRDMGVSGRVTSGPFSETLGYQQGDLTQGN